MTLILVDIISISINTMAVPIPDPYFVLTLATPVDQDNAVIDGVVAVPDEPMPKTQRQIDDKLLKKDIKDGINSYLTKCLNGRSDVYRSQLQAISNMEKSVRTFVVDYVRHLSQNDKDALFWNGVWWDPVARKKALEDAKLTRPDWTRAINEYIAREGDRDMLGLRPVLDTAAAVAMINANIAKPVEQRVPELIDLKSAFYRMDAVPSRFTEPNRVAGIRLSAAQEKVVHSDNAIDGIIQAS
jgi:hypothetical protein